MPVTESITLGALTLTASLGTGPIINVRVRGETVDVGTLHLSLAEWTSLRSLADVLARMRGEQEARGR